VLYRRAGNVVAADVIDFKTDLAGKSSALAASYREQVRQYAEAVERAYGLDPRSIRSKLVWLTTGDVETL
jgi:ATP-dependent exoDNAse (exonuclease V) beta subunit